MTSEGFRKRYKNDITYKRYFSFMETLMINTLNDLEKYLFFGAPEGVNNNYSPLMSFLSDKNNENVVVAENGYPQGTARTHTIVFVNPKTCHLFSNGIPVMINATQRITSERQDNNDYYLVESLWKTIDLMVGGVWVGFPVIGQRDVFGISRLANLKSYEESNFKDKAGTVQDVNVKNQMISMANKTQPSSSEIIYAFTSRVIIRDLKTMLTNPIGINNAIYSPIKPSDTTNNISISKEERKLVELDIDYVRIENCLYCSSAAFKQDGVSVAGL